MTGFSFGLGAGLKPAGMDCLWGNIRDVGEGGRELLVGMEWTEDILSRNLSCVGSIRSCLFWATDSAQQTQVLQFGYILLIHSIHNCTTVAT